MQCEDIRDRLIDVKAAGLVSRDPQVRMHLDTCEECRALVGRAKYAWHLLAAVPDPEPDSRAMRARFNEMMKSHERRPLFSFAWRPAYAALGIAVALATGTWMGRQFPDTRADDAGFTAVRQELREVREMLTLSLMQQAVASERIKGVTSAARMEDPPSDVVTALIDTLLHDPSVNVRLACVRALERFNTQPAVRAGVTQAVTREESPLVSMALIDFIVEAMDDMAVDALRRLSEDAERDQAVRERASNAIERLGGGRL